MITVKLKDGQSAYDVVGDYITKFWKNNYVCGVVVSIGTSYDGVDYFETIEIATPSEDLSEVEFLNDWHEGEKHIRILGIKSVYDIEITEGEGIE